MTQITEETHGALEALMQLEKAKLVELLLEAQTKAAKFERQEKESDKRVAEFERTTDAAKEVLFAELYNVACVKHDLISLANAAREILADHRRDKVQF